MKYWLCVGLSALLTAGISGCNTQSEGAYGGVAPAIKRAASQAYTTRYIQLVIFENESYPAVIGSADAPYLTKLSKTWANMTQSFAITHPSEPNYLALFSGSVHHVASDDCPVKFNTTENLGNRLLAAGLSFVGYAESMPYAGFQQCAAIPDQLPSAFLYMRKHVPWVDFPKIPDSLSKPYPGPLSKPPARFTWITPNMCDDMHDCSISHGDKWAKANLPGLIAWDQAHNGVLIVTFDENDGSPGNQIATILAGNVNVGQFNQTINHYSVLRTIEDVFGLNPLGESAKASPISGVIK